ncbi:uncharacterized protein K02A2.6-like [Tigriopus californicus]|uniref:uncharacterized protein K02A2.6-like n=1 Tax=Tigriopus californicus TaxID=6832 RepID=UPI0027D9F4FE|nr:uncharacterized protein K02A2.6-like [Tigriopus californicus]
MSGDQIPPFKSVWSNLSIQDGLAYVGFRVVVPHALRLEVLAKLHAGHQGIDCTRRLARQSVFWPGLNNEIKKYGLCQQSRPDQQNEPPAADPIPSRPMDEVHMDLFEMEGNFYLAAVDRYTGFPFLHHWPRCPSSPQVFIALTSIFFLFGSPRGIRSDNGPQFSSIEFKKFLSRWNIMWKSSSLYNPQSNGLTERTVKTLKDTLRRLQPHTIHSTAVYEALLSLRNTPRPDGVPPAYCMFHRILRPQIPTNMLDRNLDLDQANSCRAIQSQKLINAKNNIQNPYILLSKVNQYL